MACRYVLDTNVYALILQSEKGHAYTNLSEKLRDGGVLRFSLPEIVAMEIHSVIGKYRRGGAAKQEEHCTRQVLSTDGVAPCTHRCIWPARPRMKDKVFKGLQKLMRDIEGQIGSICGEVIPFNRTELEEAGRLLRQYSHYHAFGSHDALVAATVKVLRDQGVHAVLATCDKGLKAVCKLIGVPTFDPSSGVEA